MLTKCATLLTNRLNNNMGFSDKEKEIYIYGFELLLSNLSTMFIMLIISLLFGNILYPLSFLLIFFVPRLFCGGLHANTHFKCSLMTNAIFISTIIISKLLVYVNFGTPTVILSVLSLIVIIKLCPVVNVNHPVSEKIYKRNKKFSLIISIIIASTILSLFCLTNLTEIVTFSSVSFIWVSILILIETLKQRREHNGNN